VAAVFDMYPRMALKLKSIMHCPPTADHVTVMVRDQHVLDIDHCNTALNVGKAQPATIMYRLLLFRMLSPATLGCPFAALTSVLDANESAAPPNRAPGKALLLSRATERHLTRAVVNGTKSLEA
jgi:hypothetical protein